MPSLTSLPLVTPSPSQSSPCQKGVVKLKFCVPQAQAPPGDKLSGSSAILPSPSQSVVVVIGRVTEAFTPSHESNTSVPSLFSSSLVIPSPSQSTLFHAAVTLPMF